MQYRKNLNFGASTRGAFLTQLPEQFVVEDRFPQCGAFTNGRGARYRKAPQSRSLSLGLVFSGRFRLVAMFLCVSLGRFSRVMRCVMKMPLRRVRVMGRSFVVPTVMMFRRLAMMTGGVIVVFRSLAVVFRSFLRHIYSPDYSVLSISGPGGGDARTIPRHQLLDVRGSSSQGGASYHFSRLQNPPD